MEILYSTALLAEYAYIMAVGGMTILNLGVKGVATCVDYSF